MPRAGLTPDVVVAEAGRMADEVGLDRLTLVALADRLGVRQPSLYKHVRGQEALHTRLAVAALHELHRRISAVTVGRSGPAALEALAVEYRLFARDHPGTYPTTLRAPEAQEPDHVDAAARVVQVLLATLAGFGLEGDDAIDAIRGLRALLHGFVAIEAAGGYRMPQDLDRSYRRLVATFAETLQTWAGATPAAAGATSAQGSA